MHSLPLGYWGISADVELEERFYKQSQTQLADLIESLGMEVRNRASQNDTQDIIDDQTLSQMTNADLLAWLKACVARFEELVYSERLALRLKTFEALTPAQWRVISRIVNTVPLYALIDSDEFEAAVRFREIVGQLLDEDNSDD